MAVVSALLAVGSEYTTINGAGTDQAFRKRFEYKLSFKGPHLVQPDGNVPFWDYYGDAIASDDSIRITPSLKSKKGSVWSKNMNPHEDWEVEMVFRVNGRGKLGADGMAFWYALERGEDGPVFGSRDHWIGLGVFLDSYDNDALSNNPFIQAVVNRGSESFAHDEDGISQMLGGCQRDFRNKAYATRIKIEYYERTLSILYHAGLTSNADAYEICFKASDVDLPRNGYFGVSAATGAIADDHDVVSFVTHSLITNTTNEDFSSEEARKEFEREYSEYEEKLEQAKEEYQRDHPKKSFQYETEFESTEQLHEMKLIFDGQSEIGHLVRSITSTLDGVIGQQERELSMLTSASRNSQQVNQQIPFERQELITLYQSQENVAKDMQAIKSSLTDVQIQMVSGRVKMALTKGLDSPEVQQHLEEVKNSMGLIQEELKSWITNSQSPDDNVYCPSKNCITPSYLFVFLCGQLFFIIGYLYYSSYRRTAAQKKLF